MKICKIIIKDFQQFQDFELDMTYPVGHPKAGEPLEKVCLIGSNGTGKSTLLEIILHTLGNRPFEKQNASFFLIFEIQDKERYYYYQVNGTKFYGFPKSFLFKKTIDENPNWQKLFFDEKPNAHNPKWNQYIFNLGNFKNSTNTLFYVPSEATSNGYKFDDTPIVTLNDALSLFQYFPTFHSISPDTIKDFWKLLIYLIKKRENEFSTFQNQEENLERTVRQVRDEFDKKHPKILDGIAELWNKILDKAGLEFDVKNAKSPVQLNENLKAYIKLKGTDKTLPYNELSTGIRNFIFKLGHIYALYFNRNIERGFLLLDEPENSLYPDFLYDLIDIYTGIIKNTQFIVATHNPIIAAQFEPYERFLLEFDENGAVHAKRGVTPIGDDPNDLLRKDFGVRNVMGKQGVEKWERYVELKQLIPKEQDQAKKIALVEEFMKIGADYNFSV